MNIYVYQIDDYHYGAGFVRKVCETRGRIVDVLPIETVEHAKHWQMKSSNFVGVYDRVKELAEIAEKRLMDVPVDNFNELREGVLIEINSLPRWQRIKAGLKIVFGKYTEKPDGSEKTD